MVCCASMLMSSPNPKCTAGVLCEYAAESCVVVGSRALCHDSGQAGGVVGAVGRGHPNHHAQWHQPDVPLLGQEQL